MWKAIKSNIGLSLLLLLFIILGLLLTTGFLFSGIYESTNGEKAPTVAAKYSEKGLYFGPQYFIESEDGIPSRVSKKEIDDLEIGDPYTVHRSGLSSRDLLLSGIIFLLGLSFFLFIIFSLVSTIFQETRLIKWLSNRWETRKRRSRKIRPFLKKATTITVVVIITIPLLFIGKNLFYKVMPYGKTQVEAEIIDRDQDVQRGSRVVIQTYTLTLEYKNETGALYKTRKDVTRKTYDLYVDQRSIPIAYRNSNPLDVFIANQSIREWISPLFRLETLFLLTMIYLTYFILRKMIKREKWSK